jgi:hypothetical protein
LNGEDWAETQTRKENWRITEPREGAKKKSRRQRTNEQKKPEEKTRKKKPLEKEESPGNKHTDRTRE